MSNRLSRAGHTIDSNVVATEKHYKNYFSSKYVQRSHLIQSTLSKFFGIKEPRPLQLTRFVPTRFEVFDSCLLTKFWSPSWRPPVFQRAFAHCIFGTAAASKMLQIVDHARNFVSFFFDELNTRFSAQTNTFVVRMGFNSVFTCYAYHVYHANTAK